MRSKVMGFSLTTIVLVIMLSGCVEKQSNEVNKTALSLPAQYILLNHSGKLIDNIGHYTEALPGKTFLVIDLALENHGYKTFGINPNYFAIVVDKVAYPYDQATFSTPAPLTTSTLLDGGKTEGYLVFQIPEGKPLYNLAYTGPGDFKIIYGNLAKTETIQAEKKPEPTSRNLTFDIGKETKTTVSKTDISQPGYIIQDMRIEIPRDVSDEYLGFIAIKIKTITDENLIPVDKDKAIHDAINKVKGSIEEKSKSETILANREKANVYSLYSPQEGFYRNRAELYGFMPDNHTIVTVLSAMDKSKTEKLMKTLIIGEVPSST